MSDVSRPDRREEGLTPELRARWLLIKWTMAEAGHPMFLVEGLRSRERQAWLYDQGRTRPGPVVTHARPGQGRHEPGEDGLGRAFDAAFTGSQPYAESHHWAQYGAAVRAQGLVWGGDWQTPDRPHAQLKPKIE